MSRRDHDHGDYLVSLRGAGEEFLENDLEELIVLRAAHLAEGATTLRELAEALRSEADRYDRLAEDGWALTAPIADGVGDCRLHAQPRPPSGTPPDEAVTGPPASLVNLLDGARTLREAAGRLRAAAAHYVAAGDAGQRLAHPVEHGVVSVR